MGNALLFEQLKPDSSLTKLIIKCQIFGFAENHLCSPHPHPPMNSEGAGEKNFGKRVFCADGVLHCCGQCLLTAVWALTVWACPIACGTKAHLVINFKFQHVLVFISLGMDHAQGLFIR